jgi:DNA topoisomerase-1
VTPVTAGGRPAVVRLRRVVPGDPGISRRRAGRGFTYWDAAGCRVTDPETLERIRLLVIPPAWADVWISPYPGGHIQARGVDQRGRLQYVYHPRWRARRDREKFDHMLEFARALPGLRHAVGDELAAGEGLGRERILACSVRLLELGFFRVGGEGYAEENQTFGLATIEKRHVRLTGDSTVMFDYVAKSGKRRVQSVVDPEVFAIVRSLKRRRGGGPELLAYRQGCRWVDVRSSDINDYLKDVTGGDFTAKDFRTWTATVLAAVGLSVSEGARSATARRRAVTRVVKEVAHYLGNTPAVARSSYIDPRIIERYHAGSTIAGVLSDMPVPGESDHTLLHADVEAAVIALLTGDAAGAPAAFAAPG